MKGITDINLRIGNITLLQDCQSSITSLPPSDLWCTSQCVPRSWGAIWLSEWRVGHRDHGERERTTVAWGRSIRLRNKRWLENEMGWTGEREAMGPGATIYPLPSSKWSIAHKPRVASQLSSSTPPYDMVDNLTIGEGRGWWMGKGCSLRGRKRCGNVRGESMLVRYLLDLL